MLEKGKGKFIENLRFIQLCEADLNYILHTIWGYRLTTQAIKYSALDNMQYALPGQICNNAVQNKLLFLDLSRQNLSPGILTDYVTTAAFDRVLVGISAITCQRVGLPRIAGYFMFYLLKNMKFNLITGLGKSSSSYDNTQDGQTEQGVLQGSSSAAPIYILNSDVSLRLYRELGKGCAFKDPISGNLIHDKAVQFVDDTSQFLNPLGADIPDTLDSSALGISLQQIASTNKKIWSDSMWISGGKLNSSKCYHYAFLPKLNFHKNKIVYSEIPMPSPVLLHNPENKTVQPISQVNPSEARRTLGVVLNPIGDGRPQLCHSLKILRELNGKLRSSQMSSQAKLLAVEMVIYPAVMYPMVNTYFSEPEFRPITSIISPL